MLDSIDKVKKFVSMAEKFDERMELVCDKYLLNAKSIMSVFNMDLSQPFILRVYVDGERAEDIMEVFKEYIVE